MNGLRFRKRNATRETSTYNLKTPPTARGGSLACMPGGARGEVAVGLCVGAGVGDDAGGVLGRVLLFKLGQGSVEENNLGLRTRTGQDRVGPWDRTRTGPGPPGPQRLNRADWDRPGPVGTYQGRTGTGPGPDQGRIKTEPGPQAGLIAIVKIVKN